MSVRSAQSVTTEFTTRNVATGAATNADSLPTGALYVNGTANAASVTVTNQATGVYKAAVTLPTLAVNDIVSLVINATVNSITDNGKVWEDTKDVFAGAIPDVAAAAAGGLLIAGSNAATAFAGLTTGALSCTTLTVSGAVALQSTVTVTGAVLFSSTFATTGTTTFNALTVTNATTLSGAVSLGSTLGIAGTMTVNAFTCTNAFTVSGTWTSGNVPANVKAVNSITVDGSGTTNDPWGPA